MRLEIVVRGLLKYRSWSRIILIFFLNNAANFSLTFSSMLVDLSLNPPNKLIVYNVVSTMLAILLLVTTCVCSLAILLYYALETLLVETISFAMSYICGSETPRLRSFLVSKRRRWCVFESKEEFRLKRRNLKYLMLRLFRLADIAIYCAISSCVFFFISFYIITLTLGLFCINSISSYDVLIWY